MSRRLFRRPTVTAPVSIINIGAARRIPVLLAAAVVLRHRRRAAAVDGRGALLEHLSLSARIPLHVPGAVLRLHVLAGLLRQLVEILRLGGAERAHDGHGHGALLVPDLQRLRQLLAARETGRLRRTGSRYARIGVVGLCRIHLDARGEDFRVRQAPGVFLGGPLVGSGKIVPVLLWNLKFLLWC